MFIGPAVCLYPFQTGSHARIPVLFPHIQRTKWCFQTQWPLFEMMRTTKTRTNKSKISLRERAQCGISSDSLHWALSTGWLLTSAHTMPRKCQDTAHTKKAPVSELYQAQYTQAMYGTYHCHIGAPQYLFTCVYPHNTPLCGTTATPKLQNGNGGKQIKAIFSH